MDSLRYILNVVTILFIESVPVPHHTPLCKNVPLIVYLRWLIGHVSFQVDNFLPLTFRDVLTNFGTNFITVVVIMIETPIFGAVLIPVIILFLFNMVCRFLEYFYNYFN